MYVEALDKIFEEMSFLTNLFKRAELKNCLLMVMSICFSPKKTIAGMAGWLESINQSTLNKFLTQSNWLTKKLFGKYHKKIQKNVKDKKVLLLIDDSKIEKTGEKIEKVGWEYDHTKKISILCFSIVFAVVKIAGLDLPLPFAAEVCKKKNRKKDKRKKSKITLAMKIIAAFVETTQEAAKRIILFDSWYCAKKLINSIPNNIYWITRLKFKKDRLVKVKDRWLNLWKFCRSVNSWDFKRTKVSDRYFWVHTIKIEVNGLGIVTLIMTKFKHYSRGYIVFISNLDNAAEILENYEERWDIEVFFRSVKQNLGIGDVQMRNYLGNRRYWSIVLLTYSLISFLQHRWRKTCKTAGDTLAKLRKLLQNAAANYGRSLGSFVHFYVCKNFAKL